MPPADEGEPPGGMELHSPCQGPAGEQLHRWGGRSKSPKDSQTGPMREPAIDACPVPKLSYLNRTHQVSPLVPAPSLEGREIKLVKF